MAGKQARQLGGLSILSASRMQEQDQNSKAYNTSVLPKQRPSHRSNMSPRLMMNAPGTGFTSCQLPFKCACRQ